MSIDPSAGWPADEARVHIGHGRDRQPLRAVGSAAPGPDWLQAREALRSRVHHPQQKLGPQGYQCSVARYATLATLKCREIDFPVRCLCEGFCPASALADLGVCLRPVPSLVFVSPVFLGACLH